MYSSWKKIKIAECIANITYWQTKQDKKTKYIVNYYSMF